MMFTRHSIIALSTTLLLVGPTPGLAQPADAWFAGGIAGASAISADGRHVLTMSDIAVSQYKPETGLAGNLFVGKHLNDWATVQANYIWNANDLTLVSARTGSGISTYYEQPRDSAQHAVVGDWLVYFRARDSGLRPYLSVGGECCGSLVKQMGASSRLEPSHRIPSSPNTDPCSGSRLVWTSWPAQSGESATVFPRP